MSFKYCFCRYPLPRYFYFIKESFIGGRMSGKRPNLDKVRRFYLMKRTTYKRNLKLNKRKLKRRK